MSEVDAPEPGTEPQKGAQTAAPEPEPQDWEKRAKGWQAQFQATQKELENLKTTHGSLSQEYATLKAAQGTWESERAAWDQASQETETEVDQLTAAKQASDNELQKFRLIAEEFPNC